MKKVLKGIAIATVILTGLIATAIKETQDAEIERQLAVNLMELWKKL